MQHIAYYGKVCRMNIGIGIGPGALIATGVPSTGTGQLLQEDGFAILQEDRDELFVEGT